MLKSLSNLGKSIRNRHSTVFYDISQYKKIAEAVCEKKYNKLTDATLREMSLDLRKKANLGVHEDDMLLDAYALVYEAIYRVLGIYPFETQIMASIALHQGKMVEMQTGEGKTLCAVMPAYLNSLSGKGVHVLTFNDYLAKRDAEWMGPVYRFLGLSVDYVKEDMKPSERISAYLCDVTYVTAKECGFDYLRDFLCSSEDELVHRPFNYAIIDEGDSILIDEARIPLVIAGNSSDSESDNTQLSAIAGELIPHTDYELDEYCNNVYLTDSGTLKAEKMLGCKNLYSEKNTVLLSKLNCALYAHAILKKDVDYIVKDGKIQLIDEYTGRLANKRHWPDNLHSAVEAKEVITSNSKGIILGSIPLQYFLGLYPKLSGMTGTAKTSAPELKEFYGLDVIVVPTHKPCIRKDHPDMFFKKVPDKQKAIVQEIIRVHSSGQPILIGTGSVDESERLAEQLKNLGISYNVLNAKNNEMEAAIIAKAGEFGAVTVSTNMAGRGIDIKLGGADEEDRERVVATGGLYVLGTTRNESRRIDNQLKGRSGRQGDPGESRFFVSLEDGLFIKYKIDKLIYTRNYTADSEGLIENPDIQKDISNSQKLIEGYNEDIRRQLWRYSFIIEEQRRIIHKKRQAILKNEVVLKLLKQRSYERYNMLIDRYGEKLLINIEKKFTLFFINKHWADHLDYISYIRESIHLVVLGKKNPIDEFHRYAIQAFDSMLQAIEEDIVNTFNSIEITDKGIDMAGAGLKGPSSTWTYLINDSEDQFSSAHRIIKTAVDTVIKPVAAIKKFIKAFK